MNAEETAELNELRNSVMQKEHEIENGKQLTELTQSEDLSLNNKLLGVIVCLKTLNVDVSNVKHFPRQREKIYESVIVSGIEIGQALKQKPSTLRLINKVEPTDARVVVAFFAIYVPASTNNIASRLPREDNETEVIQVPDNAIALASDEQHQHQVRYQQIDRTAVFAALQILRNRPVYQGLEINEQYENGRQQLENFVVAPNTETASSSPLASSNQLQQQFQEHRYNPICGETLVWNQNNTDQALCEFKEYADEELDRLEPENLPVLNPLWDQFNKTVEFRRFINVYLGFELKIFSANGEKDLNGKRVLNNSVSFYRRSKWELEHSDIRFQSAEHIFFKYVALTVNRIQGALDVYLRQFPALQQANNNQPLTAVNVRTSRQLGQLLRANKCYELLRGIHNSPSYWAGRKREVHAMIRQLGPPTLFLTLSQAQTEWPQLLITLAKVLDNRELSEEEAEALPRQEKLDLLRRHPVTVAHYFNRKVDLLFNFMQHCAPKESPFGTDAKLVDYCVRVEFGSETGAPHTHCLLWLSGDKVPSPNSEDGQLISDFADQCISCSQGTTDAERELVAKHQMHYHSDSCQKMGECRFGYPLPPMPRTMLLTPLSAAERSAPEAQKQAQLIKNELIRRSADESQNGLTFEQMLAEPAFEGCTEQQYIDAVRYWLQSPKVFLCRTPAEMWINAYNPVLLDLHRANMDLQFVLDPYTVVAYAFKSTNKVFGNNMTPLLYRLACAVSRGVSAPLLQHHLNKIANRFLHSRQLDIHEPLYTLIGLPVSKFSRSVEFINTSPPETRDRKLKPRAELNALPPESEDIFSHNNIFYYTRRHDALKHLSLSEVYVNFRVNFFQLTANAGENDSSGDERMDVGSISSGNVSSDDDELAENENEEMEETPNDDTVNINYQDVNEFNIESMNIYDDDDDSDIDPAYDSDDDLEAVMEEENDNKTEPSSSEEEEDEEEEEEEEEELERGTVNENSLPFGNHFSITGVPGAVHQKRRKPAVIRFVNYSQERNPLNYMREQLMLYIPWRDEEREILRYCKSLEQLTVLYNHHLPEITSLKQKLFSVPEQQVFETETVNDNVQNHQVQWKPFDRQQNITLDDAFVVVYPRNDPQQPLQQGNAGRKMSKEGGEDDENDEDESLEPSSELKRPLLPPIIQEKYVLRLAALSDRQRQIVLEVLRLYSTNEPFYIFVHGGAGTGKSFIAETVRLVIANYARRRAELLRGHALPVQPDPVLLLAPTGRAAHNIGGSTIHSALRLVVPTAAGGEQRQPSSATLLPLSAPVLANLRAEHQGVSLVIVDESSMIAGLGDDFPFGRVKVILVGDFGQLRPVNDAWIFQPASNHINTGGDNTENMAILAGTSLWQQFKSFQLFRSERHRKDDAFATALNELRLGTNQLSPSSQTLFQNCQRLTNDLPVDTLHLFRSNNEVDRYNSMAIERAKALNPKANYTVSLAVDRCRGVSYLSPERRDEKLEQLANLHYTATCGLSRRLELCTGLRYMVTSNLTTNDGLVNGAIGRLMYFERMPAIKRQVQQLGRVYLLWLLFDRADVGQKARNAYSNHIKKRQEEIEYWNENWTPIKLHNWDQTDGRIRCIAHNVENFNLFAASTFADQAFRNAQVLLLTGTGQINADNYVFADHGFFAIPKSQIDPDAGLGGSVAVVKQDFIDQFETVNSQVYPKEGGRLEMMVLNFKANVYIISVFKSALFPTTDFLTLLKDLLKRPHMIAANRLLIVGGIALAPGENIQKLLALFRKCRLVSLLPNTDQVVNGVDSQKRLDIAFGRTNADISAHLYISPTSLHPPILTCKSDAFGLVHDD
ncbi:hypothetical protein TYRP_023548, partial [Tyrophagus putrescentiae]